MQAHAYSDFLTEDTCVFQHPFTKRPISSSAANIPTVTSAAEAAPVFAVAGGNTSAGAEYKIYAPRPPAAIVAKDRAPLRMSQVRLAPDGSLPLIGSSPA